MADMKKMLLLLVLSGCGGAAQNTATNFDSNPTQNTQNTSGGDDEQRPPPGACLHEGSGWVTKNGGCEYLNETASGPNYIIFSKVRTFAGSASGDPLNNDYCINLSEGGYTDWTPFTVSLIDWLLGSRGAESHLDIPANRVVITSVSPGNLEYVDFGDLTSHVTHPPYQLDAGQIICARFATN